MGKFLRFFGKLFTKSSGLTELTEAALNKKWKSNGVHVAATLIVSAFILCAYYMRMPMDDIVDCALVLVSISLLGNLAYFNLILKRREDRHDSQ